MKGQFYIDGRDSISEYGLFVEQGGYKQLIQFPTFKSSSIDIIEWLDEDGIEVDLETPKLDTRTLQIQFCIINIRYAEDLFNDLSDGAYHDFYFPELNRSWKLRMTQNGSFSYKIKLGKLTLTFADDFPTIPTQLPNNQNASDIRQKGYKLDGIDFSRFGIYILDGTDASICKAANVRENLKISTKDIHGIIYDSSLVKFKSKDVTLKCLIHCANIADFWTRYDALFAVLLKAKQRQFDYVKINNSYQCYYKSMSVLKFDIVRKNRVWCEFSIVLTFTNYRPTSNYQILATHDSTPLQFHINGCDQYLKIRPKK